MIQTSFNLQEKIDLSIKIIQEHEPEEGYYVAFSGGKDSQVVYDLVKRSGAKHDTHMNLTTVDPPEVLKFVRENYPEISLDRPEKSMRQLIIEKRMPPTRLVRFCCKWLKERGGYGRFIITGIRSKESLSRSKRKMIEPAKGRNGMFLHPILDWEESHVWEYLEWYDMPYCSLYDEGQKRIGCIMCPMQSKKKRLADSKRWPAYSSMYLHAFESCLKKRKKDGLKTTWKSGKEMYDWWISS